MDCVQESDCDCAMFADDIKIWKVIHNAADGDDFKVNLRRLDEWSRKWLLPFNSNKCAVLRLRNRNQVIDMQTCYVNDIPLREAKKQKDLDIWISDNLKPSTQGCKATKSANSMVNATKWAFEAFSADFFSKVFGTFIRPHLEYAIDGSVNPAGFQPARKGTAASHKIIKR
ncbi:unnamed protein product [Schistocephalus solidus]|uniref:Reverse transcriptase domain-containing protein n=1 Tax=Schistocephalus solidus TaxID=70667 RepID=A0A183SBG3_SCHSO|nr:unnamed protein product [Schistocephalus solidus]